MSEAERREVIAPALNKLRAFTYRQAIRHTLGQADADLRMRSVFSERKILLVNLAKGLVGPEAARLLGALVFSNLWQTALGRSAIAPERRHPVMVYIDEFVASARRITSSRLPTIARREVDLTVFAMLRRHSLARFGDLAPGTPMYVPPSSSRPDP